MLFCKRSSTFALYTLTDPRPFFLLSVRCADALWYGCQVLYRLTQELRSVPQEHFRTCRRLCDAGALQLLTEVVTVSPLFLISCLRMCVCLW